MARLQRESSLCGSIVGKRAILHLTDRPQHCGPALPIARVTAAVFFSSFPFAKTTFGPRARIGESFRAAWSPRKLREVRLAPLVYSLAPFKKNNIVTGLVPLLRQA